MKRKSIRECFKMTTPASKQAGATRNAGAIETRIGARDETEAQIQDKDKRPRQPATIPMRDRQGEDAVSAVLI
jgi:hypothetical protein